jgi:hypothetical protein
MPIDFNAWFKKKKKKSGKNLKIRNLNFLASFLRNFQGKQTIFNAVKTSSSYK